MLDKPTPSNYNPTMPKKVLAISSVIFLVAMILLGVLLWREKRNSSNTDRVDQLQETKPAENADQGTLSIPESTVASDWKTYRNEKYGFEFKLPSDYDIPENQGNFLGSQGHFLLLDPKKTDFVFMSKQGQDIVNDFLNREGRIVSSGPTDFWSISIEVIPYVDTFSFSYQTWLVKNVLKSGDINCSGRRTLDNGLDMAFSCQAGMSDYGTAYFTDNNHIVEINVNDTSYFKEPSTRDYISAILSTFRFTE